MNASPAVKRKHRLKRYGLTPAAYDAMLAAQGGACLLCGVLQSKAKQTFHIDHDHSCCPKERACDKCRRGILCMPCNQLLGRLENNREWMQRASEYIERHGASRL